MDFVGFLRRSIMLDKTNAYPSFPPMFPVEYRKAGIHTKELVISVSSAHGFAFYRSQFQTPTLFISDKLNLYYMKCFEALYQAIEDFIRMEGFSKVAFVGISKGGWACLALANLFASRDSARTYHGLVFSPQTRLFPENENLSVPSYRRLIEESSTDQTLMRSLSRYGSLPDMNQSNLIVDAYFGSRHAEDAKEAMRLSGISVALRPLPLSGHLSHLPFVIDASNRTVTTKLVDVATAQGAAVGDGMPEEQKGQFVDELVQLGKQPTIVDLTRNLLDRISPLALAALAVLCDDFAAILFGVAVV